MLYSRVSLPVKIAPEFAVFHEQFNLSAHAFVQNPYPIPRRIKLPTVGH